MADDDLEEMRHLRTRFTVGLRTNTRNRDAGSDDDDESTAVRTSSAGASSVATASQPTPSKPDVDDETDAMAAIMGFSGFASGGKKSRSFDVETLVQDIQKSRQAAKKHDSDSDDEAGPLPPKASASSSSSKPPADGDTETGPPVPSGSASQNLSNLPDDLVDDDSDFSDTEDASNEIDLDYRIPCSYDLTFEHGDKPGDLKSMNALGYHGVLSCVDPQR